MVMQSEIHEKARLLLDRSLVEGISVEERRWLDAHLAACGECSEYAELSGRAVRALDAFAFDMDPAAARLVHDAVMQAAAKPRTIPAWAGTAAALVLTAAGSLAMWQPAAWLAGRCRVPEPEWQVAFAMFWVLPSVLAAAVPLLRRRSSL
jgi:hypothetical protein